MQYQALIIPTRDRPVALARCIESLKATGWPGKLFIVHDTRGVDLPPVAQDEAAEIYTHESLGLNGAYNLGVHAAIEAGADICVFSNDDCVFERPDWWSILPTSLATCKLLLMAYGSNRFSATAMASKDIRACKLFDEAFVSGCYEDDDWWLTVGEKYCTQHPRDPLREGVIVHHKLIFHKHSDEGSAWDGQPNRKALRTKWEEVPAEARRAIRGRHPDVFWRRRAVNG